MSLFPLSKPFDPQPQYAKQVASRPYDVLNSKEAKEEAAGNPYSFLHITKSEIDLPEDIDIHSRKYMKRRKKISRHFYSEIFYSVKKNAAIISTSW